MSKKIEKTKPPVKPKPTLKIGLPAMVPLTSLRGADYNPREITRQQMNALKRSIEEFGLVEPLVVRKEDNLLAGGHQRVAAIHEWARDHKIEIDTVQVAVMYVEGLSDDRMKVLNLALNKIGGTWNYDALANIISSLQRDPELLELTGFDAAERQEMLDLMPGGGSAMPPGNGADPDELLAQDALRFSFLLSGKADAEFVRKVLTDYGMTGPRNASSAFMTAMRAAGEVIRRQRKMREEVVS
jgi:ParB-like nuclease domain